MVIQPLFRKLNSEKILYRAYYKRSINGDSKNEYIVLDLSTESRAYYDKNPRLVCDMISGYSNITPEVTFQLFEDQYKKIYDKGFFNRMTLYRIESWIKECYEFRENHRVTEYK